MVVLGQFFDLNSELTIFKVQFIQNNFFLVDFLGVFLLQFSDSILLELSNELSFFLDFR